MNEFNIYALGRQSFATDDAEMKTKIYFGRQKKSFKEIFSTTNYIIIIEKLR